MIVYCSAQRVHVMPFLKEYNCITFCLKIRASSFEILFSSKIPFTLLIQSCNFFYIFIFNNNL